MDVTVYQGLLEFNWNLLFSAVTVLVLYLILKRFFFEKVHCLMMARQAEIEEQLTHAAETERKAEILLDEYSQTLARAEDEKREILKDARKEADRRAEEILGSAKQEAQRITEDTRRKLKKEEEKLTARLREDVAELAVLAAGRILEKEVTAKEQRELVDKVIREAEEARWKEHS
ncbi:MAG: F0F1 ATP synthase subunit B [Anaerovoracaceae bacterium]